MKFAKAGILYIGAIGKVRAKPSLNDRHVAAAISKTRTNRDLTRNRGKFRQFVRNCA